MYLLVLKNQIWVFMWKPIQFPFFLFVILVSVFLVGSHMGENLKTGFQLDFHPKWEQSTLNVKTGLRTRSPSADCPRMVQTIYLLNNHLFPYLGADFLRCTKISSQRHHFLFFLPSPFLPCKDTFMDDYNRILNCSNLKYNPFEIFDNFWFIIFYGDQNIT
jgi:hypothetical protein